MHTTYTDGGILRRWMTRIAVIADVHMRDRYAPEVSRELERVVDELEERPPAHAFVLGDLIEDGETADGDRVNVRRARSILDGASFPVTYLLGNHDVENLPRETLSELLGQESFYGRHDIGGTPVVYLDSAAESRTGPSGNLGAEQLAWLDGVLPELDEPLLLVHHPMGAFDLSANEWFREYPERAFLTDRLEALGRCADAGGVRGTISGHVHETQFSRFHGLPHVSVNAFSKERPDVPLTGTFAEVSLAEPPEVTVGTRERTVATYHLD